MKKHILPRSFFVIFSLLLLITACQSQRGSYPVVRNPASLPDTAFVFEPDETFPDLGQEIDPEIVSDLNKELENEEILPQNPNEKNTSTESEILHDTIGLIKDDRPVLNYKPTPVKPVVNSEKKNETDYNGEVFYYCADTMVVNETYSIFIAFDYLQVSDLVIKELAIKKRISIDQVLSDSNRHQIFLTDSMRITISFDETSFKVMDDLKKSLRIKPNRRNSLSWNLQPLKSGPQTIEVKIENFDQGTWIESVPFSLKIFVKPNPSRWLYDFIAEFKPKFAFNYIFLPIITFGGGLFAARIRKKFLGETPKIS